MSEASSYAAVFRTPHASRTFGSALFGRLSYGMVSLSMVLAITDSTGSYVVAGGVMSVFGIAVFLLSPARAGLIDRHGPSRALPLMALLYGLLLAAMSVATWHKGSPPLLLGALAVVAGSSAPPLGPTMRMVWSVMLPDKGLLQRAYSLDTVAEELLFISGPLLAGVMIVVSGPSLGVAVSAVLVLAGTLAFVTSPVVRAVAPRAAGAKPSARGSLVWQPMIVAAALGLCMGAVALLLVAAASRHHHPAAVVWGEAGFSAGSAIGGLVYGAVTWKVPARVRLPALACVLGVLMAGAGLMPELWSLFVAVGFAGLFMSPALATAYLVADERAEPEHRTKAGAWVNTALNAGVSIGSAAAGLLVSHLPLEACFALVSLPTVLCVATLYSGTAYPGTEGQRTVITTEASSARQE